MGLNFKRKVDNSLSLKRSISGIRLVPFIIGIILIIVGLLDMFVFFFVPFSIIQKNKKKYPHLIYKKPNAAIITIHFILHVLIISFGTILVLIGLEIALPYEIIWIVFFSFLIFIFWIVQLGLCFAFAKFPGSNLTMEQLIANLNKDSPSNLIFIYTSDVIKRTSCTGTSRKKRKCHTNSYNCYSNKGYSLPIKSNLSVNSYDLSNLPDLFYVTVNQKANMSNNLSYYYSDVLSFVNSCDFKEKAIEFHPIIAGDFLLSNKVPSPLTKASKITSFVFGVGVFYELYTKSMPRISLVQNFDADIVDLFDYENILSDESCTEYGKCSTSNKRPTPYEYVFFCYK